MADYRFLGNFTTDEIDYVKELAESLPVTPANNQKIQKPLSDMGVVITNDLTFIKTAPSFKSSDMLNGGSVCIRWAKYIEDTKNPGSGRWRIDERILIESLKTTYHLSRINGCFYDSDGVVTDAEIKRRIQRTVSIILDADLNKTTEKIFGALCNYCESKEPVPDESKVFLKGGVTLNFAKDGSMTKVVDNYAVTRNRLPVTYDPEARCPVFLDFIKGLLFPEDIPMLQEFLGYLLVPTCKAQKAMFIRGQGGEGKSVLSAVIASLFGSSCATGKIGDFSENRFATSAIEGKLVFVDDDINTANITDTGILKQIITGGLPLRAERKGKDAFQFVPYCRIICMGNTDISAPYDRSDGFYRRLMITECQPITHDGDRDFSKKVLAELPGILNFAIDGLQRLIRNGYNFTISERCRMILERKKTEDCPEQSFLKDADWLELGDGEEFAISSVRLYNLFLDWCSANGIEPTAEKAARNKINDIVSGGYGCKYTRIMVAGKRVRGYQGIREKQSNIYNMRKQKTI